MKNHEAFELENLLEELVKSRSPKTQKKAARALELFKPFADNCREENFREERGLKWSWDGNDPLQLARQARRILYKAPYHLNSAKDDLRVLEEETQDLLHALEFLDLDETKRLEISDRLTNIRRVRRVTKRFVELMGPFGKFAYENKPMVTELKEVINNMGKIADSMEMRSYTPRYATDLTEAFQQIAPTKEEE